VHVSFGAIPANSKVKFKCPTFILVASLNNYFDMVILLPFPLLQLMTIEKGSQITNPLESKALIYDATRMNVKYS